MHSEVCENEILHAWGSVTIKREIHHRHWDSPWSARTWSATSGSSFLRKYKLWSVGKMKMSCIPRTVRVLLPSLLTAWLVIASLWIRWSLWGSPACLFLLFLQPWPLPHVKFSSFIMCVHEKECKKNKLLWERMRTLPFSASRASWET